ncbi:RING-H2 finger protein ATL2-like [Curcuma longa]|uniref:RING-H2 finger protein ATL2-like n=1 Tax=Curcuma longa TaxID=136217 RepID=UPI003D9DD7A4
MAEHGDPDVDDSSADAAVDQASYTFLLAAIIFLFLVVSFVLLLYLYTKRHLRRPHVLVFSASDHGASSVLPRGLDATVLRSIPVSVYRASDFGNGIECAVCICELTDGEAARILPKCGHGFHRGCIDKWFHSHSTCPLCRSPIVAEPFPILNPNYLVAGSEIPINASPALRSDQQQTSEAPSSSSARPKGDLVIEIPRRGAEGFPSPVSPLPTSRNAGEEMRTPGSTRLPALRRRWSIGKRTPPTASACSPMESDIEKGFVCFCGEGSDPPAHSPANSRLEITKPHEVHEASV